MIWIDRLAISLAIAVLLASCGTPAQRQFQAIATNTQTTDQQLIACGTAVYNSPEATSLRPHVPLDSRQASLVQLVDPSYATPEETAAILTVHPRLRACQQQAVDSIAQSMPGLVSIISQAYAEGDNDAVSLTQKKLTWGQFTARRRDRAIATQAAIIAEQGRVAGRLQQQHAL
jgi:hypothetical protein